jgi:hypothetical protein
MTHNKLLSILLASFLLIGLVGCTDVGVSPESTTTVENAFQDGQAIKGHLAKLYAGLALTGQSGEAGNPDLVQIDEGFSQYVRLWWQMQELPTDEAVIAWNDANIQNLNTQTWSSENGFASAMYSRIFFQVAQVNEFLRQTTEQKLAERDIATTIRQKVPRWRAEARFLRALSYWHAVDLFGGVPLVTEEDPIGDGTGETAPEMSTRDELFNFVERELQAITSADGEETLPPAGMAEYARADKAAAWMVLAKLYLNAEVYVGESRYDDAVTVTNEIISAYGASASALESDYHDLFLADNHTAKGVIFAVPSDGERSKNFGNTTYLVNASIGEAMVADSFGVPAGGWAGLRTTAAAVDLYESDDTRPVYENIGGGQFFTSGQQKQVETLTEFTNGFAVPKYQNVTSNGQPGKDEQFADTDYPMFRLADAYLTYAEAKLRGGTGGEFDELTLVNLLRDRAGLSDITASDLDLDYILDERGRELHWEATRRTDLVRYGRFTSGDKLWAFKGGEQQGIPTAEFKNLYPIPASEISANPNLDQEDQNEGYN